MTDTFYSVVDHVFAVAEHANDLGLDTFESDEEFKEGFRSGGYRCAAEVDEHQFAAIMPLAFTAAIVVGLKRDVAIGYEDRWCYHSIDDAITWLAEWRDRKFEGEPRGWHRHPTTGRRRPNGDATQEYVNP